MSGDELERDDILARVGMDRRGFVKKLVVGAAFATPVIASFAMSDNALGSASRLARAAFGSYEYGAYTPLEGLDHYGHRGYGAYAYSAYGYDLHVNG